jgi:hypothetical protein
MDLMLHCEEDDTYMEISFKVRNMRLCISKRFNQSSSHVQGGEFERKQESWCTLESRVAVQDTESWFGKGCLNSQIP